MRFKRIRKVMADSREGVYDSSDESSDTIKDSTSEYSTSSESETDEEDLTEATTSSGGRKRSKPAEGNATAKTTRPQKKSKVTALDSKEIEDLASWIFSSDEAKKVEQHIRSSLLNDPRVESQSDRKQFAKHLLCAAEGSNFELLVTGFCRRFSTLAQESFASNLQSYRKASFSVAWMKLLTNFQPGKITQERMIVERLLRKAPTIFSADCVHSVLSVVHETVYGMIHEHIRLKKAENEADEDSAGQRRRELPEESDDTLFRYCGAALQRMIKLRTETLGGKQGRGELSKKRKPVLEKELEILCELVMKDKSDISNSLKNSDEGNLTFPRAELIPFLRSVDREVREYATDSNLRKYPSKHCL